MDNPTRWERIQALFHAALELPEPERADYLAAQGAGDPQLAAEVQALLDADEAGGLAEPDLGQLAHQLLDGSVPVLRKIGPYRIIRVLGHGGMGVVYLGERDDLHSRVARNVLRDASLSLARRERFQREQQTLAQLNHPSIARLYDADVLPDGTPYFVMEYVEGAPITEYCAAQECSVRERLALFGAVCEAVQYAHRHAVVHRDLKPSNILVTRDGEDGVPAVKLLDFGIAKRLENGGAPADQTQTALRLMTPAYAAPEQLRGEPVGVHTDVYALGVILYELLTGSHPFDIEGLAASEVERVILETEPEKPSTRARQNGGRDASLGRTAWADLDTLCLTALHADPQLRYPTVEALLRDLRHFQAGEPLEARPATWRYRTGKFVARHRRPLALAASLAVAIVIATTLYTTRLAEARDAALAEAARTERIQQFMLGLFEGGDPAVGPADSLRVVTLLDRGVREAHSLEAEPAIRAELYQTLGTLFQQLGDFGRADSLLQHSLAMRRALFGPDHAEVAQSLLALGRLRTAQAEFDEAEHLVHEALAASRQLPAGHPTIAEATEEMGRVLTERGEYDRAVTVLEEAVRLRAAGGSEGAEVSRTLTALANAHFYAGRYATSDSLNRMVLALERRLYGRRHPHVAGTLMNLAATRNQLGFYAEAEQLHRQALAIARDTKQTLSQAVADLMRRGLRGSTAPATMSPSPRTGLPVVRLGTVITTESVRELEDDG
jgi:eukaryotic-like serine/threonine-protein kinase